MRLRPLTADDWPVAEAIYAAGIASGNATFETVPPVCERFDTEKLPDHRLVAELDGRVVGWAAVVAVSHFCADAGVASTRSTSTRRRKVEESVGHCSKR